MKKNKFIPKELAVYDGNRISHFIFKQPFELNLLSPELHKQAAWLMKCHHCINWNEGYTPLHCLADIKKKLSKDVQFVYGKGNEKAEHLKKYSCSTIIEIDNEPTIRALTPKCFHHSKSKSICALLNVFFV